MGTFKDDLMDNFSEEDIFDKICFVCGKYITTPNYDRFLGGPFCEECMEYVKEDAIIELVHPWIFHDYPVGDCRIINCLSNCLSEESEFGGNCPEDYEILYFVYN